MVGARERMQMKHYQRRAAGAAVALALAFLVGPTAHGALILDYQNGATTVVDNGPGDSSPTTGTIINTSVVAGFGVAITVATSNSPGDPTSGLLQITSLDVQNNNPNPATLIIRVSDN